MKIKLGLLLLVAGLALVGIVAAAEPPEIPEYDFDAWEMFGLMNLMMETPAFGSSWSYSYANAAPTQAWIDEFQTGLLPEEYKDAFTFTFTEANVKDTAYNIAIDPKASAGGDGVAVAAFGAANSCYPGLNEPAFWVLLDGQEFIEPFSMAGLSPALDNVAIAQTEGDVDVEMAIDNAWAHFATENTAFANELSSESASWSVGTAIADFSGF
jgi:hypothetical protein